MILLWVKRKWEKGSIYKFHNSVLNIWENTHTHTHICSLHPHTALHITFHGHTRNKVLLAEEGYRGRRRGTKEGEETGERWRLSICWSWLNLGLNFITIAAHRSRNPTDTPRKERTEKCSHSTPPPHLPFIFISLSTPGRAFWKIPPPLLGFYISHFLPLFFTSLLFLSASLLPSYSSGGLISILSEHIIDSSCLPLVKMSFIIPCDS